MQGKDTQRVAHRMLLSSSMRQFTTKMFKFINMTDYILGAHHIMIMDALDAVVRGECNRLIINLPPRYGKTALASQMFIAYGLALNPQSKFLHLSYSSTLAEENSVAVKDIVNSEYYQAVFDTRVRYGSDAKSKWATEQGGGVYATSTLGQVTGFGAGKVDKEPDDNGMVIQEFMDEFEMRFNPNKFSGAIVIDDPIKPEDALSDNMREKVNQRFETTIRNRVNSRLTPIIVIMQRLHEHDLSGYLQSAEPDTWKVIELPAIQVDGNGGEKALWPFKHTLEELYALRDVNPFVFETQYMQNPKPLEGLMYRPFKTYDIIPFDKRNKNVSTTDPADVGADYFASLFYVEAPSGNFVTDIIMTKKPMEYTEQAMAEACKRNETQVAHIETNGSGRLFLRNVERLSREMGNTKTIFHGYVQSKNKNIRIFSHANDVNNITYFPEDWERRWPEFARHVKGYRKEGVNAHDDGPDVLTASFEMRGVYSENTKKALLNQLL